MAVSPSGEVAVVADNRYHIIRHIDVTTSAVTTLAGEYNSAGTADGVGSNARFNGPYAVCLADWGRVAFVTDNGGRLRRIDVATATVTTIAGSTSTTPADGVGSNVKFNSPRGVAASPDGSVVYVTDYSGHRVRRVDVATRTVTTLAGFTAGSPDGVGTNAKFYYPWGVDVTPDGATVYVAEEGDRIRQIDVASGTVTALAGRYNTPGDTDGVGTNALFNAPRQISLAGSALFVADTSNYRIRQLDVGTGEVTTVAGTGTRSQVDGGSVAATFKSPTGIAATPNGMLVLITDEHIVRHFLPRAWDPFPPSQRPLPISPPRAPPSPPPSPPPPTPPPPVPSQQTTTTIAGFDSGNALGVGTAAKFDSPMGIAISTFGDFALVRRLRERRLRVTPTHPMLPAHAPSRCKLFNGRPVAGGRYEQPCDQVHQPDDIRGHRLCWEPIRNRRYDHPGV